jgi:hypothetical protein
MEMLRVPCLWPSSLIRTRVTCVRNLCRHGCECLRHGISARSTCIRSGANGRHTTCNVLHEPRERITWPPSFVPVLIITSYETAFRLHDYRQQIPSLKIIKKLKREHERRPYSSLQCPLFSPASDNSLYGFLIYLCTAAGTIHSIYNLPRKKKNDTS